VLDISCGIEFDPSTSPALQTPFQSPRQAPWPSSHHFSHPSSLSYVIPTGTNPTTIHLNSYLSVIGIFEKPEQAISEVKLNGITTSFKAVGMELVVRLVVHRAVDAAGMHVAVVRRKGKGSNTFTILPIDPFTTAASTIAMSEELRHDRHTVSLITGHMVFSSKYRGMVLVGDVVEK